MDALERFFKQLKEAFKDVEDANWEELETGYKAAVTEHTNKLVVKKDELLKEKKTLQADFKEFKEKFEDVDLDDIAEMREKLEEYTLNGGKNPDAVKMKEEFELLKKKQEVLWQKEIDKVKGELGAEKEEKSKLSVKFDSVLVDNELEKQFNDCNVAEQHRSILKQAFRGRATVELDELDNRIVHIKDEDGQVLPSKEFFKFWAESETSKPYVKAPVNTGGGDQGSSKFRGGATKAYKDLDLTERTNLYKENPDLYRKLRDQNVKS